MTPKKEAEEEDGMEWVNGGKEGGRKKMSSVLYTSHTPGPGNKGVPLGSFLGPSSFRKRSLLTGREGETLSSAQLCTRSYPCPARPQLLWWRRRCNDGLTLTDFPPSFGDFLICCQSCNQHDQASSLESIQRFSGFQWGYSLSTLHTGRLSGRDRNKQNDPEFTQASVKSIVYTLFSQNNTSHCNNTDFPDNVKHSKLPLRRR